MKYIIAVMGPSQSGKTLFIKKIMDNACDGFKPKLIAKQTNRELRAEEIAALGRGESIDVCPVSEFTADLMYQTYGKRTGTKIDDLINATNNNEVPVVIINDITAMAKLKKECETRDKSICVITLFLFRRIPVKNEFFEESNKRGNVPKSETEQRYDKAKALYRIYIENMYMFNYVLLNAIPYSDEEIDGKNTIIDKQIRAIRDNIILKNKYPFSRLNKNKPVLYIVSGNAASGKDELIRAALDLGKLYVDIVPKYTSRNQGFDDGEEMICKYCIDDKDKTQYIMKAKNYQKSIINKLEKLNSMNSHYKKWTKEKNLEKKDILYEEGLRAFPWWKLLQQVQKLEICEQEVLPWATKIADQPKGYILNELYSKMEKLKSVNPERFLSYRANNNKFEYVIDLDLIRKGFEHGKSQMIVLSDWDIIKKMQEEFGEQVVIIYCHSQISKEEYQRKNKSTGVEEKTANFEKQLDDFVNHFEQCRHVIIYAENEIGHESDGRQEELIDQLFRLFRAYEEQRI